VSVLTLLSTTAAMAVEPPSPEALDGPSGCHVYELQVDQVARVWMGADRETYVVTATLDQGAWSDVTWVQEQDTYGEEPMLQDARLASPFRAPWMGRLQGDNGLTAWLSAEGADTGVGVAVGTGATWTYTLSDGRSAELTIAQGDSGARWTLESGRGGQGGEHFTRWALSTDADGLPVREDLQASTGTGLWRTRYNQRIAYTRIGDC
jgi:hypothetical protein